MKVESAVKSLGGPQAADAKARPQAGKGPELATGGAKVELSSLSSSLQKAEAAIANSPVVDRSRVAEIRQAISEGRFEVNTGRIADGLIDSVRQMLADRPGLS